MRKDRLYLFTVLAISLVFLLISIIGAQYFIKASANQLLEVQVETSKREANEIASILNFQLRNKIDKTDILNNLQTTLSKSNSDTWFISIFDWSGKKVCHPDVTKVGQPVNSNSKLLASLKEKNNTNDLYDLLMSNMSKEEDDQLISEVIHIAPIKNSDLIVAANVNVKSMHKQLRKLKSNFYVIFLIMGVLVIVLSSLSVRIIGSSYEKQLEMKNSNLANEVINLSKLNTDLVSYREKKEKENKEEIVEKTNEPLDVSRKRILTYIRNELVPVLISDIAYIYTENTITYVVCFDGKKSTSNASLDDMYSNLDSSLFFRANRQFIISISAIDKIIKYGKSQLKILVHSNTSEEIIISKNKAAEFKQWLNM
ncbi:LytTr DNA-binding domain-containing protein [Tenacibaculum sp. MAR_2009_124]|uniref:LytR/AlgR family response regulator transcription factor n=1 Tax=Tenacibaculum sp. MAR_2009_124 TaxID=1250059 RepID=UPI000895FF60|nr:LytTR family DNA-binding domain-containing protein [Tenacibaculum sp. MAR_2009_124]SEC30928.1 LytTr DNA-binding domain-containing protein [Tenacibaculum sp. MAR_2009_124]